MKINRDKIKIIEKPSNPIIIRKNNWRKTIGK